MAIAYPVSLPNDQQIANVRIMGKSVVGVSENPFTLTHQVQEWDGQRWEAEVTLPPLLRSGTAEDWVTFRLKCNGRYGTFLLGDPAGATPRGTAGGTPLIQGASQTGNSLVTDGWSDSATFKAGDWFQLGSSASSRLFKNLSDQTASTGGDMTMDIWPSIRTAFANNAPLIVNSAKGVFRMSSNETGYSIAVPNIYSQTFACVSLPVA